MMSSNDGLSRMFTPGRKVETDGFTDDETTVVEITSDEEGIGVGEGVGVSRLPTVSDEDDIGELLMGSVDEGVTEMLTTSDEDRVAELVADDGSGSDELDFRVGELLENSVLICSVDVFLDHTVVRRLNGQDEGIYF